MPAFSPQLLNQAGEHPFYFGGVPREFGVVRPVEQFQISG
jgi:hypothetical protein